MTIVRQITTAQIHEIMAEHHAAQHAFNDNGVAPDENGYIRSMTGDVRLHMRRAARLLGYDNGVSSGSLRSLLVAGTKEGFRGMLEVAFSSLESSLLADTTEVEESALPKTAGAITVSSVEVEVRKPSKLALLQQLLESSSDLDEERVVALIHQHAPKPVEKVITIVFPNGERKSELSLTHNRFPDVLKAVAADVPVMLVGPAGAGKTTLCEQVASQLGMSFYFSGAIASEYKLSGFVDAQGRIVSTGFREAYTNGGLFLFDEIDASMPQAIMAFNAALAGGHCDFPGATEPVKRHPDFRVVAAANTYGRGADRQYVGRNQLDAASLDRFVVINVDYDEAMEVTLSGNTQWAKKVQRIRSVIEKQSIRHIVSPRASIMGARLLASGFSTDEALDACVWKGLDADVKSRIMQAI